MAAGRPIVASDLPAIREVITPDVHAVLVTPGSAAALADGIRRVLADPEMAARIGAAAAAAAADFTWDRRAERLEAVLRAASGGQA
jgi:glycosyltransferase involved in cell wall biosynthesis